MNTEVIHIANLKCSGCAATITDRLNKIGDVQVLNVNEDEGAVTVDYENDSTRKLIIDKLHSLGYPEATEENGLLLQAKSYASCMIGRIKS
ncbi:MAG: heavy-metal-associated domain-containing protein [Bacteroidia bacterium]